jgi:hypothetical protein
MANAYYPYFFFWRCLSILPGRIKSPLTVGSWRLSHTPYSPQNCKAYQEFAVSRHQASRFARVIFLELVRVQYSANYTTFLLQFRISQGKFQIAFTFLGCAGVC